MTKPLTAEEAINLLKSKCVRKKRKPLFTIKDERYYLCEKLILSFMIKNKIDYLDIAPDFIEDSCGEATNFTANPIECNLEIEKINELLDQSINTSIQEKLFNFLIAESLVSNKFDFLINNDNFSNKIISIRQILSQIIHLLINTKELKHSFSWEHGTASPVSLIFINKNKSLKITQQKNFSKKNKREYKIQQAIKWQEIRKRWR